MPSPRGIFISRGPLTDLEAAVGAAGRRAPLSPQRHIPFLLIGSGTVEANAFTQKGLPNLICPIQNGFPAEVGLHRGRRAQRPKHAYLHSFGLPLLTRKGKPFLMAIQLFPRSSSRRFSALKTNCS